MDREAHIRRIFHITLLLKAMHSVIEIASGALLMVVSTDSILRVAKFLTQDELLENPHDRIANYFLHATQDLSVSAKAAAGMFLLSHGAVKLVLVIGIFRGWPLAYPAFIAALGLLISYQSYQLWNSYSWGLTALTIFDALILALTWHEYRLVRMARKG